MDRNEKSLADLLQLAAEAYSELETNQCDKTIIKT